MQTLWFHHLWYKNIASCNAKISTWVHLWGEFFWNRHSWRQAFQRPWSWPSSIPRVLFRVGPQRIVAGSIGLFLPPLNILFCLPQVTAISTSPSTFLLLCRLILLYLALWCLHIKTSLQKHLPLFSSLPDQMWRWLRDGPLASDYSVSVSCQSATSLLPCFWHLKTDVCHSPRYISVRSCAVCQRAWRNVCSTRTKLFHFTAVTRSHRHCLLRNVLIYLPSHACPSSQPKCSRPQAGLPLAYPPQYRQGPVCLFHATSPASFPCRHPWSHVAATELFPRLLLLPCSHLSTGSCKCVMLRESDPLLHPSHLPHLAQGSPPLTRIHWHFCWSQAVTHEDASALFISLFG